MSVFVYNLPKKGWDQLCWVRFALHALDVKLMERATVDTSFSWYLHIFSLPFPLHFIHFLNDAILQQASFYQAPVFKMIPPLGN